MSCIIQLSKSANDNEEDIESNINNHNGKKINFKNKSNLRRNVQSSSSSSSSLASVSSYTVSTTTYNNENPCPDGINCNSPIIVIGPVGTIPQPETEIIINTKPITNSPTPSPLNKFRKIFTEVSIIFGNQADSMTGEQIKTFEQSMLDYWAYYIDSDQMFMDDVVVKYQISLSATDYLATSRDTSVGNGGNDGGRRLYNYDDYDYYGLNRQATGFNISTSLYVDPYCFGCPDPQTLQIDSINPVGASLFGRALSDNTLVISDPMHIHRVPVQERGLAKAKDNMQINIRYNGYFGAAEQSSQRETEPKQSSSKTSYSTSSTSSQSTTTTTKTFTATTSSSTTKTSSSNSKNNIFAVFSEESTPTPEIEEDVQITTTTTTTTTGATNTVTPGDGLVYFLRSTMPYYFNQVDDAMAFSHPEVSLYDSLVCYINFSIVVQEVGKDYWFLTCEQYLYHQCSAIEEQCYPEGEIPCIGL